MTLKSAAFFALLALPAFAEPPRLAVVLAVDQMRRDTLVFFERDLSGGYRRLLEKGRSYPAALEYSDTETGPGHATLATGRNPWRHGIVANEWVDAGTLRTVYCVEGESGPSPRHLLCDTLGDWAKAKDPRSRVYSVSAKDRSAVLMGGRRADGVFWLDPAAGGFTTGPEHPAAPWLAEFRKDGWFEALPETWTHETAAWLGPDDDPLEADLFSRTSPHPLRSRIPGKSFENVYRSPYADEWTLRLAREILRRFDLGNGPAPDLLFVSLSATDTVGHLYGPRSQEMRDCVMRADRLLGEFFAWLEARGAPFVVALTSDHGVLPLADAKRVSLTALLQELHAPLQKRFGPESWFEFASGHVTMNRPLAASKGVDLEELGNAIVAAARASAAVAAVYDAEQLASRAETDDPLLRLARRSWVPGRGGDFLLLPKERVLVSRYATGTSHGSPWPYDREIPLVFLGAGVAPGAREEAASSADLAPTLARLLGIPASEDVEGRALLLQ